MLDHFSRGAIIALSAACIAGAFALTPVRARSSVDGARLPLPETSATRNPESFALLPIARDPFTEPAARRPGAVVPAVPAVAANSGTLPTSRGALGALPSNLSEDTIPAVPGAASDSAPGGARITAIVTGVHPYAMIETDGLHEIKGLGDTVHGVTIVGIDINGVRLRSGERLTVAPAALR